MTQCLHQAHLVEAPKDAQLRPMPGMRLPRRCRLFPNALRMEELNKQKTSTIVQELLARDGQKQFINRCEVPPKKSDDNARFGSWHRGHCSV